MNEDDQTYRYQGDLLARIDELPVVEQLLVTELLRDPAENADELWDVLKGDD